MASKVQMRIHLPRPPFHQVSLDDHLLFHGQVSKRDLRNALGRLSLPGRRVELAETPDHEQKDRQDDLAYRRIAFRVEVGSKGRLVEMKAAGKHLVSAVAGTHALASQRESCTTKLGSFGTHEEYGLGG